MYIPSGTQGYYNILQDFNGGTSIWGMQVYLKDGIITIDGAGEGAATSSYTPDTWFKVQHFVDLNSDWVDMYIEGVLVHAYQWSKGTFDDGTGIVKLDAFNFYAWDVGGTPEYYMDNFLIEEVETPYPPTNFAFVVENDNDVVLTWAAPSEGSPEGYAIARDGEIVGTTDLLTFTDFGVYPNTYEYSLLAFYGTSSGYSPSAGTLDVNIPGGNERNLVVFEIFTGTWCPYCPTAAEAIDMMVDEGKDVAVIEYHGGDDYETSATAIKEAYYEPLFGDVDAGLGYPTTVFNGTGAMEGAYPEVADQNALYDYHYDEQITIPSVYTINLWAEPISADAEYVFNLHIDVEETLSYFEDETKMMVVLTETNIPEAWQTYDEVNFAVRNMFPDPNGTVLDFSTETIYNTVIPVTVDAVWVVDNCEVVVFIQNTATGNIQQARKVGLHTFVNSEIEKTFETTIYPNPANSILNIVAPESIDRVEVLNIAGQIVNAMDINSDSVKLNVEEYSAGVYFVKVFTQNEVSIHKIIVE
jgi:thiol-disulfide isomerase/thioredoxin